MTSRLAALGCAIATCAWSACAPSTDPRAAVAVAALGEPTDGFPTWEERVVHVWTNRARAAPADDLASCTVCAERACYTPQPPLVWQHGLARAARFHSENLTRAGCSLQHDSPCTLASGIATSYTPGPCSGDPSCACSGGSASCGSSGTSAGARIALFATTGSSWAENIAAGRSDPVQTFYQWFHEPDSSAACGWRIANGHRANILGASLRGLGVGKAPAASTWTQDFSGSGAPAAIVGGVHYPRTGSTIAFRANWYSGAAPTLAEVDVAGTCHAMSIERGTGTNGTYLASVGSVAAGCTRYAFHFVSAGTDVWYPSTGAYGIGCTTDWDATRPPACGVACTPSCAGRVCGDDGCGGSCGSCPGGETCSAAGACVCGGATTRCGAACVSTSSDESNCGACGVTCPAGESCSASACVCGGGTTRCGAACVSTSSDESNCGECGVVCPGGETCSAGACECTAGTTRCGGMCVITSSDESNCGRCGRGCAAGETCIASACVGPGVDAGPPIDPIDAGALELDAGGGIGDRDAGALAPDATPSIVDDAASSDGDAAPSADLDASVIGVDAARALDARVAPDARLAPTDRDGIVGACACRTGARDARGRGPLAVALVLAVLLVRRRRVAKGVSAA